MQNELYIFVNNLFENIKEQDKERIYIRDKNGDVIRIQIVQSNDNVTVYMNDKKMGYFENGGNGLYIFHQAHRKGIKNNLTINESIIKNICEQNENILFYGE